MNKPLLEYFENGTIKDLHRVGIVSSTYVNYFDYWKRYKYYTDQGKGYREAVTLTSEDHEVSYDTIRNAVRLIQNSG